MMINEINIALSSRLTVDDLETLYSRASEFPVELTETSTLSCEISSAKSWLKKACDCFEQNKLGTIDIDFVNKLKLEELQSFFFAVDGTKFSIPEINLFKQRYLGACSWVNHANNILGKLFERNDYHNVVEELTGILKDGESLRVKVDELPIVEKELRRSFCRKQASEDLLDGSISRSTYRSMRSLGASD